MALLEAKNLTVHYEMRRTGRRLTAVQDVSFQVESGHFVALIGPSGCGKTTILNAAAGLQPINEGELLLNGRPIKGPGRERAMVFQDAALMPWRTVMHNATYGLELQGRKRPAVYEQAQKYIDLVGLSGFENSYPRELSGGMQQRVNLARALSVEPSLLLMDEPLAALDAQTREYMQFELQRIWMETRRTAVYVTHYISEAIFLADKVIVLSARPGQIKEVVPINLPRPRMLNSKRKPEFYEIESHIWHLLQSEASNMGMIINES